ncbi:MAG: hypothetical protein ACTSPX_03480 [Candidatus Thorarchaeota archaeon]
MASSRSLTSRMVCLQVTAWMVGILALSMAGCAGPTRLTTTGVTRRKAAAALWEKGKDREFWSLGKFTKQVWEDVNCVDTSKAVLTYKVEEFFNTAYGKDVVSVQEAEPNVVTLSLTCKCKDVAFNLFWGMLSPYKRNVRLERSIMFNTARMLQDAGASISWEGKWKPQNMPIVTDRDGGLWVAYTDTSPSVAVEYLWEHDYVNTGSPEASRMCFQRHLTQDPDVDPFARIIPFQEPWESHEQVLIKVIGGDGGSLCDKPIVVVGASATGTHREVRGWAKVTVDVGAMLRERVVREIALAAAVSQQAITFVSPSPWMESIEPATADSPTTR